MAKWYSEVGEEFGTNQMTKAEFEMRARIVAIISQHTREMEGYSYFGSNPGIAEDDYEDVVDDIMAAFTMVDKPTE